VSLGLNRSSLFRNPKGDYLNQGKGGFIGKLGDAGVVLGRTGGGNSERPVGCPRTLQNMIQKTLFKTVKVPLQKSDGRGEIK